MIEVWACADAAMAEQIAPLCLAPGAGNPRPGSRDTVGKIAVLDIVGPLTRAGLSSPWRGSYGTSTAWLTDQFKSLAKDDSVAAVVLRFDSPGGQAMGTAECAAAIIELRQRKPVVAYVSGWCCSAAFWLASQAGEIFASRSSLIGSIGTLIVLVDVAEALERIGIKVHVIATSPLKGTAVPGTALTDAQRADLQRMVDATQSYFDEAVKSGRMMNDSQLAAVRTGQVWHTAEARRLRLIDSPNATFDHVLSTLGYDEKKILLEKKQRDIEERQRMYHAYKYL